ncbi:hypothetical protein [Pseudomonas sp. M30-35]|uniref:hypothetical protein n=1 Tax=Pseudomonas sp. M30-35 TaxID=1981174 RepID=UPI000B3D327C|nr:hypothetical protein [Pseudomonas sp. M30-35]ARU89045.1 hypothetical protein B9K09_14185 [Pseudomonas sp. M30-35]
MTTWIVLALLFCVLSPLAMLMPSRRLRGRMDVRMQARQFGLAVNISRQEWPHWMQRGQPATCPQYHLARRRGHKDSWCYWQAEPGQWLNQWREPCANAGLAEQLASLPADVYKAELSPQMVAVCWGESAKAQDLEAISGFLKSYF